MLEDFLEYLTGPWNALPRTDMIAFLAATGGLSALILVDDDGFLFLLDHANLAFHEAGHPIYGILGSTMALYGGTLGQLTFPIVVTLSGVLRRLPVMAGAGVVWAGQNLINIALYMADARAQELPLVGGGEHDWTNIFSRWNVLTRDLEIARVTMKMGWTLILLGAAFVLWRWWASVEQE